MIRPLIKRGFPVLLGLMIAVILIFTAHTATFQRTIRTSISHPSSCGGRPCNEEINSFKPDEITEKSTSPPKLKQWAADPVWLTVLYWMDWFEGPWSDHFGEEARLQEIGCPEYRCLFTYDRNALEAADFVFFTSSYDTNDMPPKKGHGHQHWLYSVDEPPIRMKISHNHSHFFDLIQSYSAKADIPGYNGYLLPINRTSWPSGSNKMEPESDVYKSYMEALNENKTLQDLRLSVPPQHQTRIEQVTDSFETKLKGIALMTSHCPAQSNRLSVVEKLNEFLVEDVDVYGACGTFKCNDRHPYAPWCWKNLLAPNYHFYLSMENSLCDEYITEKLYNPLVHGLVPLVYGGANYSLFLPPHSFIDVQQHTPEQLADLLQSISEDKAEYSRYHLWRAFWEPVLGGNVCATCQALHRINGTVPRPREDIYRERRLQESCHPPNSPHWFPENAEAKNILLNSTENFVDLF